MQKKAKVSIIIIAKNVADSIERCITSAICQSYEDTEVIVIEGDSSDGTRFLIEKMKENKEFSEKLTVVSSSFENSATARNIGLSKATGKYVFWLEPTDYLDRSSIEKYVEIAEKTGCDMVTNTCKDSMTGTITFDRAAYIRMILSGMCSKDLSGCMFDRDVFHNISFDNRSSVPEEQAYMAICEKCRNVTLIRRNDLYHKFPVKSVTDAKSSLDKVVVNELIYEKYAEDYPIECEYVLSRFVNLAVSLYFEGKGLFAEQDEATFADNARLLLLNHETSIKKCKLINRYTKACANSVCRKNAPAIFLLKRFWKPEA